jgi:hypothetical protein
MSRKGLPFIAGVVCLAFASVALGAPTSDTTFKMRDLGARVQYSGKVTSDPAKQKCIEDRRVEVFHRGVRIVRTLTDAQGRWKKKGPKPPKGDDVTVVVAEVRRGDKVICEEASVTKPF